MDQLKPIIQKLVTHRFWLGCSVMALATIVVAYLATSSVSDARDKYVSDIKSKFTSTQNLAGIDPAEGLANLSDEAKQAASVSFPNQDTLSEMDVVTDAAKLAARQAWGYQYQQQQKLLIFPTDLNENVRSAFSKYLPIEQKLPQFDEMTDQDQAREEYRMAYGDYIKARLPQLAKKIGAKWRPSSMDGGAMGGMGGGPMGGMGGGPMSGGPSGGGPAGMFGGSGGGSNPANPMGGGSSGALSDDPALEDDGTPEVVSWNPSNEAKWLNRATNFQGVNFNKSTKNVPTTHQVMYLQEDLWVLEAVFDVIKGTNGDADANDLAPIKTVDHILLGQDAGSVGEMSSLDAVGNASSGSGRSAADMMKAMSEAMSGGSGGSNKEEKAAESDDPAHMRYVDKDFQLIEAEEFHKDLGATSPDKAYLQVAKRIPVRLGFQMKETAILDLLSQCANSDPPIEVRQVRINRHSADEGPSMMGGGGAGMDPMAGAMGAGAPAGGGAETDEVEQDTASDVIGVEIYAVVYIYNPVPDEQDPGNILKLANPENNNGQTAMRSPVAPVPTDG